MGAARRQPRRGAAGRHVPGHALPAPDQLAGDAGAEVRVRPDSRPSRATPSPSTSTDTATRSTSILGGEGTVFLDGKAHAAAAVRHLPHPARHAARLQGVRADSETTFDLFVVSAPGSSAELRSRYWAVEPIPAEARGNGAGGERDVAMTQIGANTTKKDRVVAELRQLILSGAIPRGTRIQQDDVAAQFQVSITPVREALRQLEVEGLVVSEPHRGVIVPLVDMRSLKAVYVMRRLIEPYAFARASRRFSRLDIERAPSSRTRWRLRTSPGTQSASAAANRGFHFLFFERCGIPESRRPARGAVGRIPVGRADERRSGSGGSVASTARSSRP